MRVESRGRSFNPQSFGTHPSGQMRIETRGRPSNAQSMGHSFHVIVHQDTNLDALLHEFPYLEVLGPTLRKHDIYRPRYDPPRFDVPAADFIPNEAPASVHERLNLVAEKMTLVARRLERRREKFKEEEQRDAEHIDQLGLEYDSLKEEVGVFFASKKDVDMIEGEAHELSKECGAPREDGELIMTRTTRDEVKESAKAFKEAMRRHKGWHNSQNLPPRNPRPRNFLLRNPRDMTLRYHSDRRL
ncbi:MAG: hypothetical protein M1820_005832 [Bogoriella megaspora]|nr:MAG: hypothetical protein M1820_005832 [Bogoriella megaspora]